jgi:hypothetical protein
MAHWAELNEENYVVNVTVGNNNDPEEGYQWLMENIGGRWVKTSYNTYGGVYYDNQTREPAEDQSKALRKNYAAIGFKYDEDLDAFIPPKPYDKWSLNEDTCLWEAPIPMPNDGEKYWWNDNKGVWELVSE